MLIDKATNCVKHQGACTSERICSFFLPVGSQESFIPAWKTSLENRVYWLKPAYPHFAAQHTLCEEAPPRKGRRRGICLGN